MLIGRHTSRYAAVVAAGVLALGGLAACGETKSGGGGTSGKKKLTLIQGVANEPFYISMQCGAQEAAKKAGADFEVTAPDAWDVQKQTAVVDSVTAKKPNAVLIAPVHEEAMAGPVKRLKQAGSKIILVDTRLKDDSIGLTEISSDNLLGGKLAAQALAKLIGDKGEVMVLSVPRGTPTTDARVDGFAKEMEANHPNIKIVKTEYVADTQAAASAKVSATLAAHPNLVGIFPANLVTGEGAAAALNNAGKTGTVKVVGFDASPKQVEDLKAGKVQALIAQDPAEIGKKGVEKALEALDGKAIEKKIPTTLQEINKDNVDKPESAKYLYKKSC